MKKLDKINSLETYDRLVELGYSEREALILVKNSPAKALEIIENHTCECGEPINFHDYWPKTDIKVMNDNKQQIITISDSDSYYKYCNENCYMMSHN